MLTKAVCSFKLLLPQTAICIIKINADIAERVGRELARPYLMKPEA